MPDKTTNTTEAASSSAAARADWISALTEERDGYLAIGKTDRAALVDEQLAAFGGAAKVGGRKRTTEA